MAPVDTQERPATDEEERLAAQAQAQAEEQEGFEGEGDVQDDTPPPLEVQGTRVGQLTLDVGGNPPDSSALKLPGKRIDVPGSEFRKGDVITVALKLRVGGVSLDDTYDKQTDQVTSTVRTHKARVLAVQRLDDEAP